MIEIILVIWLIYEVATNGINWTIIGIIALLLVVAVIIEVYRNKGAPTYSNGIEYEKYVEWWLRKRGWTNIQVTRGSGDYGADIVGYDEKGIKTAVQCKMYSKPVGYSAVQQVISGMHYYGCKQAIVITNSTFTQQAQNGARRMGVKLISGVR